VLVTAVSLEPGAAPADPWRRLLRWLPWIALVVVVAVALAIGSQRHSHPTLEQRTMSIASAVRCPVCVGETAAESGTPASLEIRVYIRQSLQAGDSRSQILSHLSASYGPSILEKPSARGLNLLLWVLPALAVVAAVAGLTVAFRRWRPARIDLVSEDDRRLVGQFLDPGASSGSSTGGASPVGGASSGGGASPGGGALDPGEPPVRGDR
jgi:cytochrome c-type biogenesis protein CcmH